MYEAEPAMGPAHGSNKRVSMGVVVCLAETCEEEGHGVQREGREPGT